MTAFAREVMDGEKGNFVWEIRSVNHRYLDVNLRLPEEFRCLENQFREIINQKLNRGKIDCTLNFKASEAAQEMVINKELVSNITAAVNTITDIHHHIQPLRAIDVLSWPNVITQNQLDIDSLSNIACKCLQQSLDKLVSMRQREGEKLVQTIQTKIESLATDVQHIMSRIGEINQLLRERFNTRIQTLEVELESSRIDQEIAILIQRADVMEELDRLQSHISEVKAVINTGGVVGRKLDFIMQELGREANTLAAKSPDANMSKSAVNMKVLIEQMREQVQNIE